MAMEESSSQQSIQKSVCHPLPTRTVVEIWNMMLQVRIGGEGVGAASKSQ
jgi:hypothetical protein